MATKPQSAVDYLQAWDTSNFDTLEPGAIKTQFDTVANNLSLAVSFVLEVSADADDVQPTIAQIDGYRDDAAQHATDAAAELADAETAADAAEAAQAAAETAQATAEGHRDAAALYLSEFNPAVLEYLYGVDEDLLS